VPFTAGIYTNIAVPIIDPGGTHTLFFVFSRNPGDQNLFVLNWLEFQGPGIGIASTPFGGVARSCPEQYKRKISTRAGRDWPIPTGSRESRRAVSR